MQVIHEIKSRLNQLNQNNIMVALFANAEFRKLIIELNTKSQLYNDGVDGNGKQLGEYSPFTIEEKKRKGQRFDHVTLKDTGAFYESFELFRTNNAIFVEADVFKEDTNLLEEWGKDILGLNEKSLIVLREKAKEILKPIIVSIVTGKAA
jgi:hypothetical protein